MAAAVVVLLAAASLLAPAATSRHFLHREISATARAPSAIASLLHNGTGGAFVAWPRLSAWPRGDAEATSVDDALACAPGCPLDMDVGFDPARWRFLPRGGAGVPVPGGGGGA